MNESDIERLLRQETPEIGVRPGLETRIRASLRDAPQSKRRTIAWIALPAVALVAFFLIIILRNPPQKTELVTGDGNQAPPPSTEVVKALVPEVAAEEINPLRTETRALKNDAARTGRFLLKCLPSLAMTEK